MTMPSLLTPERIARTKELAADGIPRIYIAQDLQVRRETFYDWIEKGQKILAGEMERPPEAGGVHADYAAFVLALEAGDAEYVVRAVRAIGGAEKGHTGHQWLLERTKRAEFGPKSEVEVKHSGTVALVDWSTAGLGDLGERAIDVEFEEVGPLALTEKPGG